MIILPAQYNFLIGHVSVELSTEAWLEKSMVDCWEIYTLSTFLAAFTVFVFLHWIWNYWIFLFSSFLVFGKCIGLFKRKYCICTGHAFRIKIIFFLLNNLYSSSTFLTFLSKLRNYQSSGIKQRLLEIWLPEVNQMLSFVMRFNQMLHLQWN